MLPADLFTAEAEALLALRQAPASTPAGRWTVEFRFEGLRLLPLVLRLNQALAAAGLEPRLLCADMGATALARRDAAACLRDAESEVLAEALSRAGYDELAFVESHGGVVA